MKIRLLYLLIFLNIISCHAGDRTINDPVIIPFTLVDHRPFVEVEVNGVKGMFIVDTGGLNGFNSDFADKVNILRTDSFRIGGAGNGTQWAWYAPASDMNLSGTDILLTADRPLIVNLNMIRDSLNLPFLDGIIGEELFRNFVVSINYPDRQIILYKEIYSTEGFEMVPFSFFRNQIPMISAKIDGKQGDFTIDTGDRSSLTLFPEFFHEQKLGDTYELSALKTTGYGVGGPVLAREFYVKEVILGDNNRFISIKTRVPDHDSGSWANNSHAGNIGSAFFNDYHVIFDYGKRQLFFKKTPSLSIPQFTYHTSNLDSTVAWYEKHFPFEQISSTDTSITLQYQLAKIEFIKAEELPSLSHYKSERENKVPNGVFKFGIDIPDPQKLYVEFLPKPDVLLMGRLVNFWGRKMFLIRDPEGNVLQMFQGGDVWENSFYALITNSDEEYQGFLNKMESLQLVEESNFNNDSTGVKQQNFVRGNISIELLKLENRAEMAYNTLGASGIKFKNALNSIKTDAALPPRHHAAGTYHSDPGMIIFGGTSIHDPIGLNDTWQLKDDGKWWPLETHGPSPRSSHMLFSNDSDIFLYGGWNENKQLADLWKLENNHWENMTNQAPPGARSSAAVAYDRSKATFILYGGCADNRQMLDDTWGFKNGNWTLLKEESAPGKQCRAQMAFDEINNCVLLFGGSDSSPETWLFKQNQWQRVAESGPAPRYNHMLVNDIKRKRIVLFGGSAPGGIRFNDLWEWNGNQWEEIEFKDGPAPRDMGVMVYNEANELVYLIGGRTPLGEPINDLWTWDGKNWTRIY